ncbi:serine/threonine protein kinase [Planomonospora corallina]|uniref:Serine/threonine protein kinase n=1 Tax=Planomonospora corallina TaxID=1806052 RepID=A0ABV8IA02_9ACTN
MRPGDPEQVREYRLTARLGEGGQGTVFLGESPTGARVAVKLLRADLAQDEEALERFIREVSTAQRVSPFCTAAVLETGVDDDHRPYIVSEFIDGPTLDAVVNTEGPRSGSALHRLAIGTVTALVAIHQAGIVHRDFKPSNVLLAPDGPRVIDFGIAKALDRTSTLTAMAIGTPAYMTPEQLAGEAAGAAADMFAWGCTMVFAATGKPPFGTDSLPAIFNRIMNAEPDLSAIEDEALRGLVGDCLAKDAARRPTASEALMRLLGHAGPGTTGSAPAPEPQTILAEGSAVAAQQTGPGGPGAPYQGFPQGAVPHQTGPGGFPPQQAGPGSFQQTMYGVPTQGGTLPYGSPEAHPAGPGAFPPHQTGPGGFPPNQTGPGGFPPHQTGPGGFPPQQTGPGAFAQQLTSPAGQVPYQAGGPGGFPPGQSGPGAFQQPPFGAPQAPPPYGAHPQAPGRGSSGSGSRRGLWTVLGAVLAVVLVGGGVTLVLRGSGSDPTTPPAVTSGRDSSATPTPVAAQVPEATREVKLPGGSTTVHESDDDPIKLTAYTLENGTHLYVRGADGKFAKNDKYFEYTLNTAGTRGIGTDRVYSDDNHAMVSIVDHKTGAESDVKITKAPVFPTLPQWSPDESKALVTLYEAVDNTSKPYGFAIIDVATKKAKIVKVKEGDAGQWSYFWRGDGLAVGTWAIDTKAKTNRIRFYDPDTGVVLQTLLHVGTPLTVESDDINPSGELLMTYCKDTTQEICVWSTTVDGEPKARIPFVTERVIGWYDDQHIAAWRKTGSGYEAVVIDFRGQVKRLLAETTDTAEYGKQFMRYTRIGG